MNTLIGSNGKGIRLAGKVQRAMIILGIILGLGAGQTMSWARTISVGPQESPIPYEYNDLQAAVDTAVEGDVIEVAPGDYVFDKLEIDKDLIIRNLDPNVIPYTEMTRLSGTIEFSGEISAQCVLNGFSFVGLGLVDSEKMALQGHHTSPSILNCIFMGNGPCISLIKACDGLFQNCLIADNSQFHNCGNPAPLISDCNAFFLNCTIVNNRNGIDLSGGFIENCIITGSGPKGSSQIVSLAGYTIDVQYSDVSGWQALQANGVIAAGAGMMDKDPNFVQPGVWDPNDPTVLLIPGDYHLKCKGWRWVRYRQKWTQDDRTSPCIDAGDPNMRLGNEMYSHDRADNSYYDVNAIAGGWDPNINMGFYGGTYEASFLQDKETPATSNKQPTGGTSVLTPDPVTWEVAPFEFHATDLAWHDIYGFTMTAMPVNSSAGNTVYYMFDCSNDLYDSGWSASRTYQKQLNKQGDALKLSFRVKAKDSVTGVETGWSNNGNYTRTVEGDNN